jgi:heme-degrading monooxygenase HmoA
VSVSPQQPTAVVAALTLARYPPRAVYGALLRMGIDRLRLRRTPGLRFWRLLGSARGAVFGPWDPCRYALFTVWESAAALDAFEAGSPALAAARRAAAEIWTVRLAPVRWHGAWGGADPFAEARPADTPAQGPWAILTRATIRLRRAHAFMRAAGPVSAQLAGRPGLIAAIGLGEAPFIFQATFSLWASLPDAQAFAYREAEHAEAIRRTRAEGWYSEELFARFRPIVSYGSWDGGDPLGPYLGTMARIGTERT